MLSLYSLLMRFIAWVLPFFARFSPKLHLFVSGRKDTFSVLAKKISSKVPVFWLHTASLGEYEQGLPILKALQKQYPEAQIVVTFFSPSGYEVKKHSKDADVIVYLLLDTPSSVSSFLNLLNPSLAIFIKYEFWLNYLHQLRVRKVPTYLVSGIFRPNQLFFKSYGGFIREALRSFTHFFVQDTSSKELLQSIGFQNVTISGDTRFDRVCEILERDNHLDFLESFKGEARCIVFGSSWEEDEAIYLDFINNNARDWKIVIAPHTINAEKIALLQRKMKRKTILYTDISSQNLNDYEVLILNTIGLLTKAYFYADIAYVGGAMRTGLHNVLEPAVFGIPVIIGKSYDKFLEARELVHQGGILSVSSVQECNDAFLLLFNEKERLKRGQINATYIQNKQGATRIFMENIHLSS